MVANKTLKRIRGRGTGSVWSPKDFLDLGSRAAVDQALSRMARRGVLRRVARGLYEYPRVSPRLGVLSPDAHAVARAFAGRSGARLQPTGALAANALGLSAQVPARPAFLTDGPTRRLRIGNQTIYLRHAAPSRLRWGAVVHALAYLGQRGVTDSVLRQLRQLRQRLAAADRRTLLGDVRLAPDWMRPILDQLGPGASA